MNRSRTRWIVVLITSLVLLGVTFSSAVAAPGGNSANAKLCQKGGWEDLQRSNGTTFTNQGACVSYAAHGGTLEPKSTSIVTVSFLLGSLGDIGFCGIRVDVAGFAPGFHDVLISSEQEADYPTLIRVEADGTGSVQTIPPDLIGGTLWPEGDTVTATVAGVASDPTVVAC